MNDFTTKFELNNQLESELKKKILQCHTQYEDAIALFAGKTKGEVYEKGSNTRSIMVDAIFSLKDVCATLFDAVVDMSSKQQATDDGNLLKRFENILTNSFDNFATKFQCNKSENVICEPVHQSKNKEKHVIVLNGKQGEKKFNEQSWADAVKNTVSNELKSIPVERSVLSKEGNGCLFFPDKESQVQAQNVLNSHFAVEAVTKTQKTILPKIKVFDVDNAIYSDKNVLRQAILDKNPEINALVMNGDTLDVILINANRNDAILKSHRGL